MQYNPSFSRTFRAHATRTVVVDKLSCAATEKKAEGSDPQLDLDQWLPWSRYQDYTREIIEVLKDGRASGYLEPLAETAVNAELTGALDSGEQDGR